MSATPFEIRTTMHRNLCNSGMSPSEASEMLSLYESATLGVELDNMRKQVAEIHEFIQLLSGALNNPMVRAMIPANMRGQLGG